MAGLRRWWPLVAYASLTAYFCYPLLAHPTRLGIGDWDYFLTQQAVVLKSLLAYHQLPFWNPWMCGGNVLWQNPQVALLNPVYVAAPIVSLPLAVKLNLVAHYAIGLAGMHVLVTRRFRVTFMPAVIFLASMFVFAGGIALHLAEGHMSFLPYFYLPVVLYLYLTAMGTGSFRSIAVAGLVIGVAVLNGGVYVAALSAVAFAVFALTLSVTLRSWRPLVLLTLLAISSALFAAPKLLPTIAYLRDPFFLDARNLQVGAPMSVDLMLHALADSFLSLNTRFPGQTYGWHEYGNHIGAFALVLLIASFLWTLQRSWAREHSVGVSLAVTTVALFLLAFGETGEYAPAQLLKAVPVFSTLRPPTRFTLVFTLFAASVVARAVGNAWEGSRLLPGSQRLVGSVFVVAAALLTFQNRGLIAPAFSGAATEQQEARYPRTGQLVHELDTNPYSPNSPMYRAFLNERAIWNCYEPMQVRRVARPELPVVYGGPGTRIYRVSFTPNVIEFAAMAPGGNGRVYLNQNFATGWTSDAGAIQFEADTGRPFVAIDPDRPGSYSFRFAPRWLVPGVVLFIAGVTLAFVLRNTRLWS